MGSPIANSTYQSSSHSYPSDAGGVGNGTLESDGHLLAGIGIPFVASTIAITSSGSNRLMKATSRVRHLLPAYLRYLHLLAKLWIGSIMLWYPLCKYSVDFPVMVDLPIARHNTPSPVLRDLLALLATACQNSMHYLPLIAVH